MGRLNVLIWHIHGSYLNALARVDHDWILPVKAGRPEGYGGRGATFDLPPNMREVPAEEVRNLDIDVVVLQTPKNLRRTCRSSSAGTSGASHPLSGAQRATSRRREHAAPLRRRARSARPRDAVSTG